MYKNCNSQSKLFIEYSTVDNENCVVCNYFASHNKADSRNSKIVVPPLFYAESHSTLGFLYIMCRQLFLLMDWVSPFQNCRRQRDQQENNFAVKLYIIDRSILKYVRITLLLISLDRMS